MALTTGLTDSFVLDLFTKDGPDFDGTPNLKLALYTAAATHAPASTPAYTTTDELTATGGYTTGGNAVAVASTYPKLETGTTTVVDLDDVQWTSATFTTGGGILYQDTASDESVAVYAFSASPSAGTLTVQWPTPGASAGAIYITRA